MLFLTIIQKSKLIHTILYLYKNINYSSCYILVKSVFDKDKNNYYYNIILEKG